MQAVLSLCWSHTSYCRFCRLIIPTLFRKNVRDIVIPSVRLSVCLSVMLSPPKPLDRIQPNLVSGLLTQVGRARLIELGFNDTSTLVGHFVSSPREREKIDRRDSRRDEREGQGRKRNRNESEETEEIKTSPPYPYLLQG